MKYYTLVFTEELSMNYLKENTVNYTPIKSREFTPAKNERVVSVSTSTVNLGETVLVLYTYLIQVV